MKDNKFKYGIHNTYTAEVFSTNNKRDFFNMLESLVREELLAGNKPKVIFQLQQTIVSVGATYRLLAYLEEESKND